MVISRTPFRVSFFGGGTDYPIWYKKNQGSIISTSINKYSYVTCRYLPPFFDYNFRIRYTKQEYTNKISDIIHPSVRECLNYLKFKKGIEMQHNADLPAMSGLGSSSSFTVGFLNALYALRNQMVDKQKLAMDAIYVEQNLIGESVGSQDQTISAYGGFNKIDFCDKHDIKVRPIIINEKRLNLLQNHLMLFFTGFSRRASNIAKTQIRMTPKKTKELNLMLKLVDEAYKILMDSKFPIAEFGKLLDENWKIKKSLTTKISNGIIDQIYNSAIKAGATGGKLLGAGGGGFMLFFVKPSYQKRVLQKLKKLLYVPFKFENYGSQIIYKMPDDF
ncbi:kinase [Candidatus Curtissbacteria bacterium RBG_13_35_7]|uniref:Kinase n=1 Tax=Candidatus Curtissbacteria bacterium RBG_13_35_7 TaxID=1797705 RepID=A0A1F5G3A4_9BACT|nr:MAG: kinase [Candidatus Curtissbacteria bacterium RBG_13_35_7]